MKACITLILLVICCTCTAQQLSSPTKYSLLSLETSKTIKLTKTGDGKYILVIEKVPATAKLHISRLDFDTGPQGKLSSDSSFVSDVTAFASDELVLQDDSKKEIELHILTDRNINKQGSKADGPSPVIATGIAWWDAIKIAEALESNNETTVLAIVNQYAKTPVVSFKNIDPRITKGQITDQKLPSLDAQKKLELNSLTGLSGALLGGAAGGIDVTNYVQPIADFLRDRIKAELTIAFINRLKDTINAHIELRYLLANTNQVFQTSDPFSIPTMGDSYKKAFIEDISQLPENFEKMVAQEKNYLALQKDEAYWMFMIAYNAVKISANGKHAADVISLLNGTYGLDTTTERKQKANYLLSVLDMLSQNLRNLPAAGPAATGTVNAKWLSKDDLKLANKKVVNIFIALLSMKYAPLFNYNTGSTTLSAMLSDVDKASEKVISFLTIANSIDTRINDYKKDIAAAGQSADEKRKTTINYFLSQSDDLLEFLESSGRTTGILSTFPEQKVTRAFDVARQSIVVAKAINTNNIGLATSGSVRLISMFLKPDGPGVQKLLTNLTFYTNFITDMANADSANKIKEVLDKYAAPAESYRAVRLSGSSVTLAAYPGLFAGYEFPYKNPGTNVSNNGRGNFGITAPIGVSVNVGDFQHDEKRSGSRSLFIQLIDIAAALQYRWGNTSTDLPQKVYLRQIFSPGLAFVYGFPNSPVALKFGAQYSPLLRSVTDNTKNYDVNVFSATASMTVDIPVFIFSRKARSPEKGEKTARQLKNEAEQRKKNPPVTPVSLDPSALILDSTNTAKQNGHSFLTPLVSAHPEYFKKSLQLSGVSVRDGLFYAASERCSKMLVLKENGKNTFDTVKIIPLHPAADVKLSPKELESITTYGRYQLMTDEENQCIYYTDSGGELHLVNIDAKGRLKLEASSRNYGLEGIAAGKDVCFVLKERNDSFQSEIYEFKIKSDAKGVSMEYRRTIAVKHDRLSSSPEKNIRYSDIFFDEKKGILYCLKTFKGDGVIPAQYRVDQIKPSSSSDDIALTISKEHSFDFTTDVEQAGRDGYHTNLEGLTMFGNFLYVVSDNAEGATDCDAVQQKTTFFAKLPVPDWK